MTSARFSTPLCALFIAVVAIAAAPTSARANDFATPFGGKATSPSPATGLAANTDESGSAHVGAISLASSFAHHEGHSGLGGTVARPVPGAVGMREHEDEGVWRHHEDDGNDDGHKDTVPEPSSALLVFSGIVALAGWTVRRRKQAIIPTNLA